MEYLMTYGWAILIIAIVLGVLFSLGVFNSSTFYGTTCTSIVGYVCSAPALSSGTFTATVGQLTGTTWQSVSIFFVAGGGTPSNVPSSLTNCVYSIANAVPSDNKFQVTLNSPVVLNSGIGACATPFTRSGALWAEYTQQGISGVQFAQIATVTLPASSASASTTISTTSSTTSTTSTTATSTSTSTTTITYTYNGAITGGTSLSITLPSGYNWYFCTMNDFNADPFTISWTQDLGPNALPFGSIGHQSSNVCSTTSGNAIALAGIGESGAASYNLLTSGVTNAGSYTITYNAIAGQYTFILLSDQYADTVSLPSGCTQVEAQLGPYSGYPNNVEAYIAVCSGQSVGQYTATVTTTLVGAAVHGYVVYSVT